MFNLVTDEIHEEINRSLNNISLSWMYSETFTVIYI